MPETSILIKAKNLTWAAFAEIQQSLDKTATYFNTLAQKSTQAEKGMTGALNRVKNALKENQEGFQAITLGMGAVAATSGLLAKSFLDAATRMETMKIASTATVGSSAKAERQLVRLREVAKLPGLGFPEAVQGNVNLRQVGFSAEMAERMLTGVGNALVLVGKGRAELEGVTTAFVQMHTKGLVSAEEINQIAERMPQIRAAMLAAFGTADTEVIQKMGLTTQQFISGVMTELEKLPKATGGAANAVENLADAWFQLRASLGESLLPAFAKLINTLSSIAEWVNNLSDTAKAIIGWGTALTAGIATLGTAFGGLLMALPGIIAGFTTLSGILGGLSLGAAAPIVAVTAGVVGLIEVFRRLNQQMDATEYVSRNLGKALSDVSTLELDAEITAVRLEINKLETSLLKTGPVAAGLLIGIQAGVSGMLPGFSTSVSQTTERLNELRKILEDLESTREKRIPLGPPPPTKVAMRIGDDTIKTEIALRQRQLELIEDRYEKEREQARLTAEEKIATAQKEIKDSEQLNKAIAIEKQILAKTLTDIDRRAAEERAKIAEQEAKESQERLNAWVKSRVQAGVIATNAELQEIEKRKIAEQTALEEMLLPYLAHEEQTKAAQNRIAKAAMQEIDDEAQARKELSKIKIGVTDTYFKMIQAQREQNQRAEEADTDKDVKENERRMAERDHLTEKMLENSEAEVQAFYEAVQKNKKMSEDLERNVERFSSRAAELLIQIPFRLGEAFITGKGSIKGIIKDFFSGMAQLIFQEAQRIISMRIAAKITASLLPAAGGSAAGGLAAGLGGLGLSLGGALPVVGLGLAAYQLYKGGFDSPVNDRMAQRLGQQTALVYGASFDNPVNDYRAKVQGMMAASQAMGERSAGDMVTHFQRGFIRGANEEKGGDSSTDNEFKDILTKLERRLGETPQLRVYLGDREITSVVRREIDKQNTRRMAY